MVRIVGGIDVYRHALAMLGDGVGMGDFFIIWHESDVHYTLLPYITLNV